MNALQPAALAGCSGFTHLHSPRPLAARGASATVGVVVPEDFSLRFGLGNGWDAGFRFTAPGMGFRELHADVQRDPDPGGTAVVFQPYVAHGDDRAYAALRPTLVFSPDDGRTGWLSLVSAGTARGDRVRLVPELNLVGLRPTLALGLLLREERR